MHVRKVKLTKFIQHRSTTLALPERGIVTVVGPNEQGKSAIVEGISYALWGRTLRGEDPFDADGAAFVETDVMVSERERKGKKTTLRFHPPGGMNDAPIYATTTKAQEALEHIIGDWQTWQQTHVFSAADAARWTLATDGERKRFVEGLLRYDFDKPLAACRAELRAASDVVAAHTIRLSELKGTVSNLGQRIAENQAVLVKTIAEEPLPPPPDAPADRAAELAELDLQIAAGQTLIDSLTRKGRGTTTATAEASADLRQARERWAALRGGRCPTCEQLIPPAMQDSLREAVDAGAALAKDVAARAEEERRAVDAELGEVKAEQDVLVRARADLRAAEKRGGEDVARWEADRRRRDRDVELRAAAEGNIAAAQERLDTATAEITRLTPALDEARADVEVLVACETVLGLRGVRAQVTSRALAGLEAATNVFLRRIARPGVAIRLRPYTEKARGGVSDSIAMEWRDGEHWRRYQAASTGARRRIDVAVLLALSEVAAAASDTQVGTSFYDEVFDSLDEDGIERVSAVLAERAAERCVVVISHNESLVRRLPAVLRLRVDAGRISVDGAPLSD